MRTKEYERDRFDRMRRIEWLDIDAIQNSKCLVVGAGALGNEVIKCMVLAGFGDITVVDMDKVAVSNLSRCLFFRDEDDGMNKAEVLVERASATYDGVRLMSIVSKIQDMDDWNYDVVLGCLDNISARLHVNSHARFNDIPYVDGATDGFRGKVQVVLADGPCLECTMNKSHMSVLDTRFSCTGSGVMFTPKMASEITTTSVVAAVQVREAMKILSGRNELCIRNIMFYDGERGTSENLESSVDPCCPNHTETGK